MFSVGKHVQCSRTASDAHPDLIILLDAVRDGWDPPTNITEEQYNVLRQADSSAERGFVGFGCSFYGKFFGGFARDPKMNDFGTIARNNMLKLVPLIQHVEFQCEEYHEYDGEADLIYCDPPYYGTTDYSGGKFDSALFWDWVREWSTKSTVLVSEYVAPDDFETLWEKPYTTTMKDKSGKGCKRIEKLFRHTT
jgi:DNA adenine methylase